MFALPWMLVSVGRFLRRFDVKVVNVHYVGLASLIFAILKQLGLYSGLLVLSFHGTDIHEAATVHGWRRLLWRLLGSSADMVIACSHDLAKEVRTVFPSWYRKLQVVHNGLTVEHFVRQGDLVQSQPFPLRTERYFLNVATFGRHKGQDVLVRAFAQLPIEHVEMKLVLVGCDATWRAELERLICELGLEGRVLLFLNVEHRDIAPFFKHATVFVLPSRTEAFGIVVLEAGAFGLPVVASSVGGVPEIICDREYGVLVQPEDVAALADAMGGVLALPDKGRAMGAALRDRVRSRFSWECAYRKYATLCLGEEA